MLLRPSLLLLLLLLALVCLAPPGWAAPGQDRLGARLAERLAQAEALPEDGLRVIVKLREDAVASRGAGRAARRAAIAARQQGLLDAVSLQGFRVHRRHRNSAGFSGWAERNAIAVLSAHPDVERVYLDGVVRAHLVQGRALVGGDDALAAGYTGLGVNVAVLDTGIDSDHSGLSNSLVAQRCFCDDHPSLSFGCCPNGDDEQTTGNAAEDDEGHGTAVAGIVTWWRSVSSNAGVVAIKVLDATGAGNFSDVDAALDWVLDNANAYPHPIRVVNMSLGNDIEYSLDSVAPCSGSTTADLVEMLVQEGITVVAASGNEAFANGISFPACVPDVISVGGVYDAALGKASWCGYPTCAPYLCTDNNTAADDFVCHSNSGSLLDVLAPNWRTNTTAVGGSSASFGGTSAAAPSIASQAALLYEADPSITPAQVRTLLKSHGPMVTNPANGLSFRRSNVAGALTELVGGTDTDGDGVPEDGDGSGTPGDDPCEDGEIYLCDDSCPAAWDPGQTDTDGDGIGDVCEPACSNGLDDDGDGLVDFAGSDPGCDDAEDSEETSASLLCDNGDDDDLDGYVDVADPGCVHPSWPKEDPACDDGIDNDGDGGTDHDGNPADTQCLARSWAQSEAAIGCGLGAELVFLLPLLQRLRRTRRPRRS
jgi:subtilisin family serine protease